MSRPEYLVSFLPRSTEVNRIHKVIGDTDKYWMCHLNVAGDRLFVRKSNLMAKGSNLQYVAWTRDQVETYRYKQKLINKVKCIQPSKLSVAQLEKIIEIMEN